MATINAHHVAIGGVVETSLTERAIEEGGIPLRKDRRRDDNRKVKRTGAYRKDPNGYNLFMKDGRRKWREAWEANINLQVLGQKAPGQ